MIRLIALSLALVSPAMQADQGNLALVGGTAITIADSKPVQDSVVLVSDGKIEHVGRRNDTDIPESYQIIDAKGRWITPGLIDTNVHLILMVTRH